MREEVLTDAQKRLLGLLKEFREFYLAGGTSIALQIGHRRSIDFDLFSTSPLNTIRIINTIKRLRLKIDTTLEETSEELTVVIDGVKVTFLEYPFQVKPSVRFDDIIVMPDLLTLAAMKAYSLGRRSRWKDYVDLYFTFRDHYSLKQVSQKAREIFGGGFNERLFREQLCYFEDIDFSEGIDYLKDAVDDEAIKQFLMRASVEV